ncbi:glycosyl hydrolase [Streptomyces fructofermentans]|uniref:glycosyl hydrolase n=1 Tax=Streptomyces fructofermentans TaxID=152141 RepID=UPI0033DE7CDB
MTTELDFRLDDFEPADAVSELAESSPWAGDLTVLAEHHTTPNWAQSYLVAHDGSVTWGVPGEPQLVAIKITRDPRERTFTLETASHASLAFAQNWLVEHGCPPEPIAQVGADLIQPADDLTVRVEQQIRASGDWYKVLATQTSDYAPCETWTMVRDSGAAQAPIRVFLEKVATDDRTYTVREGAFVDENAAQDWLDNRDGPLPEPPEYRGDGAALRTRIALTRSTSPSAIPKAGLNTSTAPSVNSAQRPNPRRSM